MRTRLHNSFGHGLAPGSDHDINCQSCTRERREGTAPHIMGSDDQRDYPDSPVKCPNGHPTGRQAPIYEGHGEGFPYATGQFRCEVCGEKYWPEDLPGFGSLVDAEATLAVALVTYGARWARMSADDGRDERGIREGSGKRIRDLVRSSPWLRDVFDYVTPHRHDDNA